LQAVSSRWNRSVSGRSNGTTAAPPARSTPRLPPAPGPRVPRSRSGRRARQVGHDLAPRGPRRSPGAGCCDAGGGDRYPPTGTRPSPHLSTAILHGNQRRDTPQADPVAGLAAWVLGASHQPDRCCVVCPRPTARALIRKWHVTRCVATFGSIGDALQARRFADAGYGAGWHPDPPGRPLSKSGNELSLQRDSGQRTQRALTHDLQQLSP
jgi:hypothetical protein